jgi:hypothetical protein
MSANAKPVPAPMLLAPIDCTLIDAAMPHEHAHERTWPQRIPVYDLKSFWGAVGCACSAA